MEIRLDDLTGAAIRAFLEDHLRTMHELSPPESVHALDLDGLRNPEITFWTVWSGDELLGCGAFPDMTCGNWTKSSADGAAMTGHHDRAGPVPHPWATSWNSSHSTRGGCGQEALRSTGGDGLFYCFAAK